MKAISFDNIELEETTDLGKPSKEEYERAKSDMEFASHALSLSRKNKNKLLDELLAEHQREIIYLQMYETQREIIRKYDFYEEVEKGSK